MLGFKFLIIPTVLFTLFYVLIWVYAHVLELLGLSSSSGDSWSDALRGEADESTAGMLKNFLCMIGRFCFMMYVVWMPLVGIVFFFCTAILVFILRAIVMAGH